MPKQSGPDLCEFTGSGEPSRPDGRGRFVLLCQQSIVLASVAALGFSAVSVVQLDFVAPLDSTSEASAPAAPSNAVRAAATPVAGEAVTPKVREVELDASVSAQSLDTRGRDALSARAAGSMVTLKTAPEEAPGYSVVGLTWKQGTGDVGSDHGAEADSNGREPDSVELLFRSQVDGTWGPWEELHSDESHQPEAVEQAAVATRQDEARVAVRGGTDAAVVGRVDQVQAKVVGAASDIPDGLALSIVDPGTDINLTEQPPAIDASEFASGAEPTAQSGAGAARFSNATYESRAASAVEVTPAPQIFSRAQWGADERLRDAGSLRYGEVQAGFVHHTVNANDYTKAQVPGILRGIYAYHTKSRGWSDVGYNFLVDRFGQIWEGRYGGVDRPVVGAHTLGYNDDAFAMSAIGNFDITAPSDAMIKAYSALFAWKLALHGVRADDMSQQVVGRSFPAINGHRDAGSTACPGRYLYARISEIRAGAAALQRPWASRQPQADLAGKSWPDLVVRDKGTGRVSLIETEGQLRFLKPVTAATGFTTSDLVVAVGDLTGDGIGDVLARDRATQRTDLRPGSGTGPHLAAVVSTNLFAGVKVLSGAGDFNGDGRNDLIAVTSDGSLMLYPGRGGLSFATPVKLSGAAGSYDLITGVDDFTGDGNTDLVARRGSALWVLPGTRKGLATPVAIPGDWSGFDVLAGRGDATGDGLPDLVARVAATKMTYIYPGNGAGGLGARLGGWKRYKKLSTIALGGQLMGSKHPDIIGSKPNGKLRVYANSGRRNLGKITELTMDLSQAGLLLNVGDWNGDGHGDLMTRESGKLVFRAGLGNRAFAAPVLAGSGFGKVQVLAAVGDVTGDGRPDLMGRAATGEMRIYPSNGAAGFAKSFTAYSSIASDSHVGIGLFDSDGAPDSLFRRSDGTLWAWLGNGPGGLMSGRQVGTGAQRYDWMRGLGDMDGNGRADVIARETGTGYLWLLPGRPNGLAERRLIGTGFGAYGLLG